MERVTLKALILAAAVIAPQFAVSSVETVTVKKIDQLSLEERATLTRPKHCTDNVARPDGSN